MALAMAGGAPLRKRFALHRIRDTHRRPEGESRFARSPPSGGAGEADFGAGAHKSAIFM